MNRTPLHQVAIVGVYNTKQARVLPEHSPLTLTVEALLGAIADSGLTVAEIDGVVCTGGRGSDHFNVADIIHLMGGRPCWYGNGWGIAGIVEAAAAIAVGLCETVAIASGQAAMRGDRVSVAPGLRPSNEFVECWGLHTPAEWAFNAIRHMHLYGTRQEALAEVASAIRMNGANNPNASYSGRTATPEDVLASRVVAEPFHLLDCCTRTEGGAGMVLTTVERARALNVRPVYILGAGVEITGSAYKMPAIWERQRLFMRRAAQRAFGMADLQPKDIDVCQWYDNFSFEIIRKFEACGFCNEGEGGDFVMGGRVRIDGEFPVDTDGGMLAYSNPGMAQMFQRVSEGVLQIQDRAALQVPKVRYAIADNFTENVIILGAEPAKG